MVVVISNEMRASGRKFGKSRCGIIGEHVDLFDSFASVFMWNLQ